MIIVFTYKSFYISLLIQYIGDLYKSKQNKSGKMNTHGKKEGMGGWVAL